MSDLALSYASIGAKQILDGQRQIIEQAIQQAELLKPIMDFKSGLSRLLEGQANMIASLSIESEGISRLMQSMTNERIVAFDRMIESTNVALSQFKFDFDAYGAILLEVTRGAKIIQKRRKRTFKAIMRQFRNYFAGKNLVFPESFNGFWDWYLAKHEGDSRIDAWIDEFSEHDIQDYCEWLTQMHERARDLRAREITGSGDSQPTETNTQIDKSKPRFNPEYVPIIFDLLKEFFSDEHQNNLQTLLGTGNDVPERLTFLDSGNRLAYAFKQLIDGDIITACMKIELEGWIFRNFKYRYRREIKEFTPPYLNTLVSTATRPCKNPIFNVVSDSNGKQILKKC